MSVKTLLLALVALLLNTSAQAIIYRHDVPVEQYKELANNPAFDCVGEMYRLDADTQALAGSCVLVGDRYVLTAWHVLKYGKGLLLNDYSVVFNGERYVVVAYESYAADHDVVLLKLGKAVPSITPATLNTMQDEVGDTVTMVGYGSLRASDMLTSPMILGIKVAAHNIIDSIGGKRWMHDIQCEVYADFDGANMPEMAPLPLEGLLNGGDSGGGIFVKRNGKWLLAGIASGGHFSVNTKTGFYGSTMSWARASVYANWIQESIQKMKKV